MKRLVSSRLVAVVIDWLKSKLRRSAKAEFLLAVPETGTFSLKPIIDDLVEEFRPIAEQKNLVFVGIFNGADVSVNGDCVLLSNVIHKLLDNAIKHTLNGYIVLNAEYMSGKVVICVGDSGTGVNEADMTGRDFSEIRDIIASLRGTMVVISDGGKGCKVIVKVPMKIARA